MCWGSFIAPSYRHVVFVSDGKPIWMCLGQGRVRAPAVLRPKSVHCKLATARQPAPAPLAAWRTPQLRSPSAPSAPSTTRAHSHSRRPLCVQNIDTVSMNSGELPVIGMLDTYVAPGSHAMFVPCPRSRATAVVRLELRDANGILYVDEFQQSFHMQFHKLLKWLAAGPLLAMGLFLLVLRPARQLELPS